MTKFLRDNCCKPNGCGSYVYIVGELITYFESRRAGLSG